MIIEITRDNFEEEVLKSDKKVLVDFWATWCNPCKMMHPVLEKLDKELNGDVKIGKINIDNDPELASKFGVMSIPTFMVFENGELKNTLVGTQSLETLKKIMKK